MLIGRSPRGFTDTKIGVFLTRAYMSRLSHLVAAPLLAVSHAASATTGAQLHAAQESKVGDCWEKTQEHVWCTDAAYGANGMFSGDLHEPTVEAGLEACEERCMEYGERCIAVYYGLCSSHDAGCGGVDRPQHCGLCSAPLRVAPADPMQPGTIGDDMNLYQRVPCP